MSSSLCHSSDSNSHTPLPRMHLGPLLSGTAEYISEYVLYLYSFKVKHVPTFVFGFLSHAEKEFGINTTKELSPLQ